MPRDAAGIGVDAARCRFALPPFVVWAYRVKTKEDTMEHLMFVIDPPARTGRIELRPTTPLDFPNPQH